MEYFLLFSLLFSCPFKYAESTVRTLDMERLCIPSNQALEGPNSEQTYICNGINSLPEIIHNIPSKVSGIIISNSEVYGKEFTNSEKTKNFKKLSSVEITQSYIEDGMLKWLESLEQLQFLSIVESSNSFTLSYGHANVTNMTTLDLNIDPFKHLKKLHISNGNISNLWVEDIEKAPFLELSDNKFECGQNFSWLLEYYEMPSKVLLNNSFCFVKKTLDDTIFPMIYSVRGKPLSSFLKYKREAVVNCPPKCTCALQGMYTVNRPQLNVDCINISMTEFPKVIPKGTSRCNFSYNMIEDLTPLYTNNIYESVAAIALSHNHISYLDPVKFPDFLRRRKDSGFWLDHNRLEKFPAEEIEKVYEEVAKEAKESRELRFLPQFFLGGNPYKCACDYISNFQNFIYQHMYDIYDARNIHCSRDGLYSSNVTILVLDVGELCSSDGAYLDTLDTINLILGILLIIMIIDFIYNYRQYKKNRKLPWLVTFFKC